MQFIAEVVGVQIREGVKEGRAWKLRLAQMVVKIPGQGGAVETLVCKIRLPSEMPDHIQPGQYSVVLRPIVNRDTELEFVLSQLVPVGDQVKKAA